MNIVDNIKAVCADRGITVTELERRIGISDNGIYKWKTNSPSIDKVRRVSEVLNVPIERLIGREEP